MDYWTPTFSGWGDNFNDAGMPWYVKYDYVMVEKYNQETGRFDYHWRDDFDTFDENRWFKSNGWGLGSSIFWPENVYTENGHLVFKMDHGMTVDSKSQVEINTDVEVGQEVTDVEIPTFTH